MKSNYKAIAALFCSLLPGYSHSDYQKVQETYKSEALPANPSFKGGLINFGYWKEINIKNKNLLLEEDRIKSSLDLYRLIFNQINPQKTDVILEVGCGQGVGGVELLRNYQIKSLKCLDISTDQITKAKLNFEKNGSSENSSVHLSKGEDTGFENETIDKIYSVEALQYFESIPQFANEAHRILKKGGIIAVTAHFSSSQEGYQECRKLLPTVSNNIDKMIPINNVREAFINAGFEEVKFFSIGEHVFEGHDRWCRQISEKNWVKNILRLFNAGKIDYYVLVFEK
jgi:cyclopropane fatty-acyl-phospholipid synthase-like methyltransferase